MSGSTTHFTDPPLGESSPRAFEQGTVSVVIPTRNRMETLPRAIESALGQTLPPHEVLVVDDASTDGTLEFVAGLGDSRVRSLQQIRQQGAAAARNRGVDEAAGEFVAFLDSDDEWLPEHLERRVRLLRRSGAAGAFGGFDVVRDGGRRVPRGMRGWPENTPVIEYILSREGGARSSTLVFRRDAIARVRFDHTLRKHQDWDVVARFAADERMICDPMTTAILHEDSPGRMTARMDHDATWQFLTRHLHVLTDRTAARVLVLLALRTLRVEGRGVPLVRYLDAARPHLPAASSGVRLAAWCLATPGLDVLFSALHSRYTRLRGG